MAYRAPLEDILFCLDHMVGRKRLIETGAYPDLEDGTADAILAEAARTFEETVAPAHRPADTEGAQLENGVVRTPPEFHSAYAALREGGWTGIAARPESGGAGMPQTVVTPVNEMLGSSCLSLSLNPLLTQGVVLALERHADENLRSTYVPRLVSGEWAGTMVLTEPRAGSDVGAVATRAQPRGDGSWSITGQKIFISWGDSDLTENIVHLVLARTPDAPGGTAGLSLFLVPKFLPPKRVRNGVQALSLERKMGLHGSPTALLAFEDAVGWLVGPERAGISCMFTMMNAARLGVGVQGVSIAEASRQLGAAYALERRQGRTSSGGAIIGHEDVRRMVLEMRALTDAARAVCYDLAIVLDLEAAASTAEQRNRAASRAALLTPIAKAFGSETGIDVSSLALQIHGGAGYIEETGAAQWYRDARITAIYEGTNGIQAMDLVGRKIVADNGAEAEAVLDEVDATASALEAAGTSLAEIGRRTRAAAEAARETTRWMATRDSPADRRAGAAAFLRLLALTRGAHHLGRGALAASTDPLRVGVASFFARALLPQTAALAEAARIGSAELFLASDDRLAY